MKPTRSAILFTGSLLAALVACTPLPVEPVLEQLDTQTGTTLSAIPAPVELLTEEPRGASRDPFAYLAPFETNRMGERTRYLWVTMPEDSGQLSQPQVTCGGASIELGEEVPADAAQFGLAKLPFNPPAPWSRQWYFQLPDEGFACLGGASEIAVSAQDSKGRAQKFVAKGEQLGALSAFVTQLSQ